MQKKILHAAASSPSDSHNFKIRGVPVDRIDVPDNRRALNPTKVAALAHSMAEVGLRTPITVQEVDGKVILGPGRHRLAAAKELGWPQIHAFIFEGDATDARLWELAENLFRDDLTVLEQAESINEWVKLVQEKKKAGQLAQPGGQQPHDKNISGTARELGIAREEVRRSATIAGILPVAKKKVCEKGLDNNQAALLKIAKGKSADEQLDIVKQIENPPPAKPKDSDKYTHVESAWKRAKEFRDAWAKLAKPDCKLFFKGVMEAYDPKKAEAD